MAAYMDHRKDALLDAAVTAAALIARADGSVESAERRELLDVLRRNGLLSVFTRFDVLDAFESRLRKLEEERGIEAAFNSLRPFAGRSPAWLLVEIGERVAAADGHVDGRELQMLRLIRIALSGPIVRRREPSRRLGREGSNAETLSNFHEEECLHMAERQNFKPVAQGRRVDSLALTHNTAQSREQRVQGLIGRLPPPLQQKVRWLRRPSSRWVRVPVGFLLIAGGFLSILPLFGIWMLPLGLILLAEDIAALQRNRDRLLDWIEHRYPHWIQG
jgi:tellurite resistance protein